MNRVPNRNVFDRIHANEFGLPDIFRSSEIPVVQGCLIEYCWLRIIQSFVFESENENPIEIIVHFGGLRSYVECLRNVRSARFGQ